MTSEAFAAPERERAGAPAAAAPMASSVRQDERIAGDVSVPESERAFGRLEASRPRTAAQWRRLRDAWSAFAAAHPDDPRADEARVRAIEAGREAWLAGGADDDEAAFRARRAGLPGAGGCPPEGTRGATADAARPAALKPPPRRVAGR